MNAFVSHTTKRVIMPQKKAVREWREVVAKCARSAIRNEKWLLGGAKFVELGFVLKAPKKNDRKRPHVKPDIDKVSRAILDSLTGILYDDDAQVCELLAWKVYPDDRFTEVGVYVTVADM